jgi:YHS domain-containing protein
MKNPKLLAVLFVISLAFVFSGFARQTADESVACPVSGKAMTKSEAKATYEYQGKTYYFCCEGCQEEFVKDPEKYLQQKEAAKEVYTCPMHPEVQSDQPGKCAKCGMNLVKKAAPQEQAMMMTHGPMGCCQQMGMGAQAGAMNCPFYLKDADITTENLADGVAVKVTSKDPETVKKIQENFAALKACRQKAGAAPKQEEKK